MDTSDETPGRISIVDIFAFIVSLFVLTVLWHLIQEGFIPLAPWIIIAGLPALWFILQFLYAAVWKYFFPEHKFWSNSTIPMTVLTLLLTGVSLVGFDEIFDVNEILRNLIEKQKFQRVEFLIPSANFSRFFPDGSTLLTVATCKEGELLNGDPSKFAVSKWFASMLNTGRTSLRLHEDGSGLDVLAYSLSNPILFDYVTAMYNRNPQHGHPADGNDYPARRNLYHIALDCHFIEIKNLGKTVEKIDRYFKLDTYQEDAYKQTPLDLLLANQKHQKTIAECPWGSRDSTYAVAVKSLLIGQKKDIRDRARGTLTASSNTRKPSVADGKNYWAENLNSFISYIDELPEPQR